MSATANTRAFRGETLEEALRQVREELGPEAIVVMQREGIIGGVGGFFGKRCVEIEVEVPSAPAEADVWADDSWTDQWATPRVLPPRSVVDLYDTGEEPEAAPVTPAAESWPWPMPDSAPSALPVLVSEPELRRAPEPIHDPAGMQRRLTSSGLDERLARDVVGQAESELRFFDPTEPFEQQVRTMLARRIRVARAPRKAGQRVIALVGPQGSGKTLTAARLCYAHATGAGSS